MKNEMTKSALPQNTVQVIFIDNPFDPSNNRKSFDVAFKEDETADYYIKQAYFKVNPVANGLPAFTVGVNGSVTEDLPAIRNNDTITVCPEVLGGGGGGNKILRTVGMLAVAILSIYTGGLAAAAYGALAGAAVGAAVGIGGSLLVNSVFPTATPSMDGVGATDWGESSPTWGWNVTGNPVRESAPLPIAIGICKATPPLIAKHITTEGDKQYLNLLYAVNDGRLDDIQNIMINDNPIINYKDIYTEVRLGGQFQSVCEPFNDTRLEQPVNVKLTDESDSVTEQLQDAEISSDYWLETVTEPSTHKLDITITYPDGLYAEESYQSVSFGSTGKSGIFTSFGSRIGGTSGGDGFSGGGGLGSSGSRGMGGDASHSGSNSASGGDATA